MRVAVTGGAGFIGANLVSAMVSQGHGLLVVDDLSAGSADNVHPAATFHVLDVLDPSFPKVLADFGPDVLVHLAAQTDVSASIADPERDRLVNVEGTRAVTRAAAAAGTGRVLSASSAAVYGEPAELPLVEESPKRPANPYGASKLEAERVLADELRAAAVDFASLRFSNVYGPHQDWRGEGGVVAIFSALMCRGEAPTIRGDGEQTRDFIYVGDVVDAIAGALAMTTPLAGPGPEGPAYNISTGVETSVCEMAAAIASAAGFDGELRHEPAPAGDVARSALDPSKAREAFGWIAATGIGHGIGVTVDWFRRQV